MPVAPDRILHSFEHDATLGAIVDTVSNCLGGQLWFRGEAQDFPIPANSELARVTPRPNLDPITPDFTFGPHSFPLRVLTLYEQDIITCIQKNPPPDPYFPSLLTHLDHPGWLALARHHRQPTRLVDVTWDLLVAVYFACSDAPEKDGFIFAYSGLWDPNTHHPVKHYKDLYDAAIGDKIPAYRDAEITTPGTLETHAEMLATETKSIRGDMAYLFRCEDVINERMSTQRGAFIWRGDPTLPLFDGVANTFAFRIAATAKLGIIRQLNILGINKIELRLP